MGRHEITVDETINATPQRVYEILSDSAHVAKWMPNVSEVKVTNPKKGVGATRHIRMQMHDLSIESEQRVTVADPGKKFEWVHDKDLLDGKPFDLLEDVGTRFVLEAVGKSTKVTATAFFSPSGIKAKLAVPFVSKDVKKQMQTALANLKRLSEAK